MVKYLQISLQEDVKFPQRLSELAKAVLTGLLEKSPKKRYVLIHA